MAEKFHIPVVTLIDTPGAYPGIGAEERGQSEAIARNLYVMAELKTPIIGVIIGEGGSGGALALGVVDQLLMLQYGTYSVISPEGCASILYKSADKASVAAESLAITADRLKGMGLVDRIVPEPLGGAHRSPEAMMDTLRTVLKEELARFKTKSIKSLLVTRYERLMSYGKFKEVAEK
jgi:acetyl-CoA carboxylase carboxyl transferase subunit alpha